MIRYIELNWFEMDKKGMQSGIFTFYELMEDIDDSKDWDIVMAVGYPTPEGFEESKAKAVFKEIRSQHKEVLVNGAGLKDLGQIVSHYRLRIKSGSAA